MKHNWRVTLILVLLFLAAQYIGLYINYRYQLLELPFGIQRPEMGEFSFVNLFAIIIFVTLIAFLLARFKFSRLWKLWFFIASWFTLMIAVGVFVDQKFAALIGFIGALFKVYELDIYIHNLTELFIYGGLAAIFSPMFNMWSISILLVIIAVYDAISVWKTKHMIKLAKFQSKLKIFAGLLVPYEKKRAAILGGGDIGFPLLFASVAMKTSGLSALAIPVVVGVSLFLLLLYGDKNKFYPAMPYLAAGCFLGYGISLLI